MTGLLLYHNSDFIDTLSALLEDTTTISAANSAVLHLLNNTGNKII